MTEDMWCTTEDENIELKIKINVGIDANNGKIKGDFLLEIDFNIIYFLLKMFDFRGILYIYLP